MSVIGYSQKVDSIRYANGYLYYHSYGKGEPVLILTGGPGASYLQLEEVAKRVGQTHHALLLEQRGTGRSMPVPYDTSTINIRTAHEDILRLLDHLNIKKASLLGHSWGGMLAMSFAAQHPQRVTSLLLIDSGPFSVDRNFSDIYSANMEVRLSAPEKEQRRKVFSAGKNNMTKEIQQEIYKWELVPVLYDRTKVDSLIQVINKGELNPKTGAMLFQSFMKGSGGLKEKLIKLPVPVSIIAGAQDPGAFMSYEIKQLIPQATIFWINRSGHFPMYEQPEEFYKALETVLPK
jgi:pimeloyl-ACP methyl ester carboxylesterase